MLFRPYNVYIICICCVVQTLIHNDLINNGMMVTKKINYMSESSKEREHLGEIGIYERIILKWGFKNYVKMLLDPYG